MTLRALISVRKYSQFWMSGRILNFGKNVVLQTFWAHVHFNDDRGITIETRMGLGLARPDLIFVTVRFVLDSKVGGGVFSLFSPTKSRFSMRFPPLSDKFLVFSRNTSPWAHTLQNLLMFRYHVHPCLIVVLGDLSRFVVRVPRVVSTEVKSILLNKTGFFSHKSV